MPSIIADIALIATPIVIAVGFYFAYGQWAATRKARMAEVVIRITDRWDSLLMAESRREVNLSGPNLKADYENADKSNDKKVFGSLTRTANFFDTLGVLVTEGFLECKIAYDLFGKAEKTYYRLYDPLINNPQYKDYTPYFCSLHDLFIKEEARRSQVKKRRAS